MVLTEGGPAPSVVHRDVDRIPHRLSRPSHRFPVPRSGADLRRRWHAAGTLLGGGSAGGESHHATAAGLRRDSPHPGEGQDHQERGRRQGPQVEDVHPEHRRSDEDRDGAAVDDRCDRRLLQVEGVDEVRASTVASAFSSGIPKTWSMKSGIEAVWNGL